MHRFIDDQTPYILYNPLILTKDYSKTFTARLWQIIEHMAMFIGKSIVIQLDGQGFGSISVLCNLV